MIKLVETLRDVNCDRCDEKILNMRCDATRTLEHWNMQLHTLHYRWGSQPISEIFAKEEQIFWHIMSRRSRKANHQLVSRIKREGLVGM